MQAMLEASSNDRREDDNDASPVDGADLDAMTEAGDSRLPAVSREDAPSHPAVRVLMQRSRIAQLMKSIPQYRNIVIIEDDARDSDRLASTLRSIFGYEIHLRQCPTLGTALDALIEEEPDLVFLNDRLGPVDKAEKSVPFLRAARCVATIIVVSSCFSRRRRAEVLKLGVAEVIDKDELDGLTICEALVKAHVEKQ